MDKMDFEIEVENKKSEEVASVQLPLNFLTFGEIENDDVKVYIKQDVYKKLEKFAESDTSKELGSILLGEYCEELGKTHVVISDYIEAKYTDASAATLTFTHETWDYVHKEHARLYPGKKIIGWQHTHPNYGIFLSNYDMFIQENFFNLPFQIAYVIDPIQNLRGFFQWKNGKVEKLKGYYIYDEVGKPVKIEQKKVEKETSKSSGKTSNFAIVLLAVMCVLAIGMSVFAIAINNKQKAIMSEIEEQENVIDTLENQILELELQLEETAKKEVAEDVQEDLPEEEQDVVSFKAYTVKAGDTLTAICNENGIDYVQNKKIILSMNGITNPSSIRVGQVILLPIVK